MGYFLCIFNGNWVKGKDEDEDEEGNEEKKFIREQFKEILEENKNLRDLKEMKLFGWVMFRIINNRREVRLGKYTERLVLPPIVKPPVPEKYAKTHKMKKTSVSFKLESFDYNKDSLPYFLEQKNKNAKAKFKFKVVKNLDFKQNDDPFIVNHKKQFKEKEFLKGNGIDIYVDSARFLPDNVGPCKLVMRVINSENEDFLTVYQAGLPQITSDIFNPIFDFRHELRAPQYSKDLVVVFFLLSWDTQDQLIQQAKEIVAEQENIFAGQGKELPSQESNLPDRTSRAKSFFESNLRSRISRRIGPSGIQHSVLLNQIKNLGKDLNGVLEETEQTRETEVNEELEIIDDLLVELEDCQMKVIGFSAMNLFVSPKELNQRNKDKQFLKNGMYQLPIFCQKPVGFSAEMLDGLDRFPCASLLVRIHEAPVSQNALKVLSITNENPKDWEKYGLWQRGVPYHSGFYNNSGIKLSDNEKELFGIRQARPNLPIKFYMNHFMKSNAEKLLFSQQDNDYEKEDIQFSGDQIIHFLDKYLSINRVDDVYKLDKIDLKFFNKYKQSVGVKFSLDILGNFDNSKGFPFVVSWVIHSKFNQTPFPLTVQLLDLPDKKKNYLDMFLDKRKQLSDENEEKNNLLFKYFINRRIDWEESSKKLIIFNEDYIKINNLEANDRAFVLMGG
jgi:molybdopterin-guanine dinucleotide biosynthesis protein A